ncbi:autophagocytosis associated protein [Phascolomyces articulosus]|uniref:Ubiquitin-like-conjugating enzyme ATG10 n=1 Tax=Phascolomyces articulosus TaxID=60185 RepID=A0AAD5KP59_9FUNG|nr:autophagocytosis associated protein [Phascolomyces articulosus]
MDELLVLQETSDPATAKLSEQEGETHLTVEYHIVYSPGYQVPVLYFNGYDAGKKKRTPLSLKEGTALSLDELYQWIISKEMQQSLQHGNRLSQQGSISQEDHPILGFPFYYIHPCETQSMMRLISHDINIHSYIKSWLSLIGPTIGCTLSHQLFLSSPTNK